MATKRKPYKPKSLEGAARRVRELQNIIEQYERHGQERRREVILLAKLAAKGPAFTNPLEAFAAEHIRDQWLRIVGLNPDGTPITKGTP